MKKTEARGKELSVSTEGDVILALEAHFDPQAYAFFPQVPERTGGGCRVADAMAMSLWRSRGLELIGFEVKCARGDWATELKNPEKADALCRYCNRWYLVAGDPTIVKANELPATWGLMVLDKGVIREVVKAPALKPDDFTREFIAALLRRAKQHVVPKVAIEGRIKAARDDAFKTASEMYDRRLQEVLQATRDAARRVELFEKLVGRHIDTDAGVERAAAQFRAFLSLQEADGLRGLVSRTARAIDLLQRAAESAANAIEQLKEGEPTDGR